jgi:hypothetical protein
MAESSRAPEAANSPSKTPTLKPAVPDSVTRWKTLARKLDGWQTTVNGLKGSGPSKNRLQSASDMTQKQFIYIWAFWPTIKATKYFPTNDECIKRAKEDIDKWPVFQAYEKAIRNPKGSEDALDLAELGPLTQARML